MRIAIAALTALMLSGLAGAAHAQPPGSYLRSCTDVRMRGDTLLALCRREDGRMERSVLTDVGRCVGGIANLNGELVCNRRQGALSSEPYRHHDRYDHPYGSNEYGQSYGQEQYYNQYGPDEYNRPYGPGEYNRPYGYR